MRCNNHVPNSLADACFLLIDKVQLYLDKYDEIMREPASFDRGVKIAQIQNELEFELFFAKKQCTSWHEIELIQFEQNQANKQVE